MTSARERLREDVLACFAAAVDAVRPEPLVARSMAAIEELSRHPRVHVAAIGKAAVGMARAAGRALGERLGAALVLAPPPVGEAPPGFALHVGAHPVPDEGSVAGGRAVLALAEGLGPDDLLLVLLSGGGSSLLTLPANRLSLDDVRRTTSELLAAGATIHQLNCVRKHLDRLKGGRLARAARPAHVVGLVLSDVVGDAPDVVASGPIAPDPTTYEDAIDVLGRLGVWRRVPARVQEHLMLGQAGEEEESPKPGDPCFERVSVRVIGNNRLAADAAAAEAARRGYATVLLSTRLTGEARDAGRMLAAVAREVRTSGAPVRPPACLLAGGETTVEVRGGGRGGRNQEVALGAALDLDGVVGVAVASIGTDGIDGPTDAAGAIAYGDTVERAAEAGFDPRAALAANDAYPFFRALGDLIVTGPTGTNVMDLQLALVLEEAVAAPASPPAPSVSAAAAPPPVGEALRRTQPVPPDAAGEPVAFAALGLGSAGLAAARAAGFRQPMPIQERVVPAARGGRDLVGLAETGSGKTAAFCLPLIDALTGRRGTRVVVLCPTREIALQTTAYLEQVGPAGGVTAVALIGGLALGPQADRLRRAPTFVVATPGRFLDHLERGNLDVSGVRELVIDEADHMLDLGFLPQVRRILEQLPAARRTMMFSATMPDPIERLAERFLREPLRIDLRPEGGAKEGIRHDLYLVEEADKKACLMALLRQEEGSTLVFLRRKVDAEWACRQLELEGHPVDRLHSDRTQAQRIDALTRFREGEHRILVATDVAARGLDIPQIEHIINFDVPETVEDYIHRAGRTARGHRHGQVSTIATWRDRPLIREIEARLGREIPRCRAPGVEGLAERPGERRRKKILRRRLL